MRIRSPYLWRFAAPSPKGERQNAVNSRACFSMSAKAKRTKNPCFASCEAGIITTSIPRLIRRRPRHSQHANRRGTHHHPAHAHHHVASIERTILHDRSSFPQVSLGAFGFLYTNACGLRCQGEHIFYRATQLYSRRCKRGRGITGAFTSTCPIPSLPPASLPRR